MGLEYFKGQLDYPGITAFISDRKGGVSVGPYASFNIGFNCGDDPKLVLENRRLLARQLGILPDDFITGKQVHGTTFRRVELKDRGTGAKDYASAFEATDALITDVPGLCLMVLVADCVPIIFFDPVKKAIGVAHAGWRGTSAKVAPQVIKAMQREYACRPEDIIAGIGPSIGPCCYEVGPEVAERFPRKFLDEKGHLDLWAANKDQLITAGLPVGNIEHLRFCTKCHAERFFSSRAGQGLTGRFAAGIILKV